MKESKTQDLIDSLYTLRAGMSIIAQEKTVMDNIILQGKRKSETIINNARQKVINGQKKCENIGKQLSESKNNEEQYRGGHRLKLLQGLIKNLFCFVVVIAMFAIAVAPIVWAIMIDLALKGKFGDYNSLPNWLFSDIVDINDSKSTVILGNVIFIVVGLLLLALAIYLLYKIINDWYWFDSPIYKKIIRNITRKKNYRKAVQKSERLRLELKNAQNELKLLNKNLEDENRKADEILKQAQTEALPHRKAAVALLQLLNHTFMDIIDIRDWSNVDMLIYSLETKRAETMKEAFAIVDSERRMERLTAAIDYASKEVCRTLNSAFNRTNRLIENGFSKLCTSLSAMEYQMASMHNDFKQQSSYLSSIVTQNNFQNALIQQSNVSTAEMSKNIQEINRNTHKMAYGYF